MSGIFQSLDTVLIRVRDVAASKAWYEEKLGFKEAYFDPFERLVVFDLGGTTSLTLWELKEGEELVYGTPVTAFPIFSTADASRTWSTLRDRGVDVSEIVESSGVTSFAFKDHDGNVLEACQVH